MQPEWGFIFLVWLVGTGAVPGPVWTWGLFPLKLSCSSFPDFDDFLLRLHWSVLCWSLEGLCTFSESFPCVALSSLGFPCEAWPPGISGCPALCLQLTESAGFLLWVPVLWQETLQAVSGAVISFTLFVSLLSRITVLCCLLSNVWKLSFSVFCLIFFPIGSGKSVNVFLVTPSCPKAEISQIPALRTCSSWKKPRFPEYSVCALVAQSCLILCSPMDFSHSAPLSLEFSRQEHWRGVPFPPPGHLPYPGIETGSPASQVDSLPSEPPGKPPEYPK